MLINMLKAVEKMLDVDTKKADSSDTDAAEFVARVDCARVILGEIIASLQVPGATPLVTPPVVCTPINQAVPKSEGIEDIEQGEKSYRVEWKVDPLSGDKLLVRIENAEPKDLVEIDGKRMTYEDAIGKPIKASVMVV